MAEIPGIISFGVLYLKVGGRENEKIYVCYIMSVLLIRLFA